MASKIASAYVQIIPSTKGFKSKLSSELGGSTGGMGSEAGELFGNELVGKLKGIIAAAGIGEMLKTALSAGGDLQQSFGGLDTIYGDASQAAKDYARDAVKAGISMNDYAEQAVSFGASLKQAFSGDVTKAAEAANVAIMDMADNSAKMGTDLSMVQSAYQGFAKQNYTMLDNLKLGYGGTKEEMKRLLEDASKLSGQKYDMSNLGDVYDAIHVIQEDLGLTGVAAEEASETFTGSFGAMKASAQNLLADLTTGGDVKGSFAQLLVSSETFLMKNMVPMLKDLVGNIPTILESISNGIAPRLFNVALRMINNMSKGISEKIPALAQEFLPMILNISETIREKAGLLVDAGLNLVKNIAVGIANSIPTLVENVPSIVSNLAGVINDNAPKILATGVQIIVTLARGIWEALPVIMENLPKIIQAIWDVFTAVNWIELGANVIRGIANALKNGLPELGGSVTNLAKNIVAKFKSFDFKAIGKNIIQGILNGMKAMAKNLTDWIAKLCGSLVDTAKEILKIKSPSRAFRDEVGKWIPAGIAVGIDKNAKTTLDSIHRLGNETMRVASADMDFSKVSYGSIKPSASNTDFDALAKAIEEQKTTVNVTLQGDTRKFFKAMQEESTLFNTRTGQPAFT